MVPEGETLVIDDEFIKALEYKSNNKIRRAYFYETEPQYLILSLTNQLYAGTCRPTLILELTPAILPKDFRSNVILKCFGLHRESEIIYDIIRTTCQGYWSERGRMLFFEEYAENAEEEPISILELIMNIMSTFFFHTAESSQNSLLQNLHEFFEN